MLAQEFTEVLSLETPTKKSPYSEAQSQETNAFFLQAKGCLENMLECEDIEVIYQVRNEFKEFCAKIRRALRQIGDTSFAAQPLQLSLERLRTTTAEVERIIVDCERRLHVCCEYHELKSATFLAVERELEDMQDLLFQITEHSLSPNSRSQPSIGKLYSQLKDKIAPLKASVQFIPLRVQCYRLSAQNYFPASVSCLSSESLRLASRVHLFTQEFNKVDVLLKSEWWDPDLETSLTNAKSRTRRANSAGVSSSIPVFNLRLRGQRKSVPPKFVSKIPKPTEVSKPRPNSIDKCPSAYGHYRSSSQWSTGSTISQDSLPSPAESLESPQLLDIRASKLFDQAPLILPPSEPSLNRPQSRLVKPTPVDLTKIRQQANNTNKENDEFSSVPVSFRRPALSLSTISESPVTRSSMIPTFSGSPVVRKHSRIAHLYQTPLR